MNNTGASITKKHKTVLYVEDDQAQIFLMQENLDSMGNPFVLDTARSMEEALEIFDATQHKLVVLDYNLRDATAPEIAIALLNKAPGTKIVVLSEAYAEEHIAKAKAAGIGQCLQKGKNKDCLEQMNALLNSGSI